MSLNLSIIVEDTIYPAVLESLRGPREDKALAESLPFWPSSPSNGIDEWGNPAVVLPLFPRDLFVTSNKN